MFFITTCLEFLFTKYILVPKKYIHIHYFNTYIIHYLISLPSVLISSQISHKIATGLSQTSCHFDVSVVFPLLYELCKKNTKLIIINK